MLILLGSSGLFASLFWGRNFLLWDSNWYSDKVLGTTFISFNGKDIRFCHLFIVLPAINLKSTELIWPVGNLVQKESAGFVKMVQYLHWQNYSCIRERDGLPSSGPPISVKASWHQFERHLYKSKWLINSSIAICWSKESATCFLLPGMEIAIRWSASWQIVCFMGAGQRMVEPRWNFRLFIHSGRKPREIKRNHRNKKERWLINDF